MQNIQPCLKSQQTLWQKQTEAIRATARKLGLQMSFKITEILPIGRQSSKTAPVVPLGNEGIIKVVDHFKYLVAYCSADGSNGKELNHRLGKVSGIFRELDVVWKDRNINLSTKMKFYNALFCLPYCMPLNVGASQREMKLDYMPLICDASVRSCRLPGPNMSQIST